MPRTPVVLLLTLLSGMSFAVGVAAAAPQDAADSDSDTTAAALFSAHDRCLSCHSSFSGYRVPIAYPWRSSMMANSARDPYWQGSVRAEVMDHPELRTAIEDKCATCHMPMARFGAAAGGAPGRVFENLDASGLGVDQTSAATAGKADLAADGVSCAVCHQIRPSNFGESSSYSGHFEIDTAPSLDGREILGPYDVDAGRRTIMRSATGFEATKANHLRESELCATCHTLYTNYTDPQGDPAGEMPEQVPYLEWLHSAYRTERSCQDCHMPEVEGTAPISSVVGQERERVSRHAFRGGNRYMLSVLDAYAEELGVVATREELREAIAQTDDNLQESSARLRIESIRRDSGTLEAQLLVENLAGHKLPTAYPSRRAWLHFTVRTADGTVVFESGGLSPQGAIVANDNDDDATRYEPHRQVIETPDQVQIYEPILVNTEGAVTTGLLFAARYAKDNRLLPRGFDPATADPDVAVYGAAGQDADFIGGSDRVRYRVPVAGHDGPLVVEAELLYQSIAFRWGRNLGRHEAPEIGRFLDIHDATGGASAVTLASASRSVD